jgi:hypothetical protein
MIPSWCGGQASKGYTLILVKMAHKETKIIEFYMKEIFRLHGMPKEIMSADIPSSHQIFGKGYLKDLGQI